jgi:hypothetical protein
MHQTTGLRQFEVRAPISGQIVERRVDLGAPVGREGQESEIFVIADQYCPVNLRGMAQNANSGAAF